MRTQKHGPSLFVYELCGLPHTRVASRVPCELLACVELAAELIYLAAVRIGLAFELRDGQPAALDLRLERAHAPRRAGCSGR